MSILADRAGHVLHRLGGVKEILSVDDLLIRIFADLHPGQQAFVEDQSTDIIGVSAGYGAGKMIIRDGIMYYACGTQGLRIMDVSNPGNMVELGRYNVSGSRAWIDQGAPWPDEAPDRKGF